MKNNTTPRVPFVFATPKNPFAVPAGRYKAIVKSVKMTDEQPDGTKKAVKITFGLFENATGPTEFLAKKQYSQTAGTYDQLHTDLRAFFSATGIEDMQESHAVIDLTDLVDREVDVFIVTFSSPGYPTPFSKIEDIFPAGTLFPEKEAEPEDDFACAA